jgi:DNA-binding IclR family transcriptional regulator
LVVLDISQGQRVSGAVAMAAPIFGPIGRPVSDTILTIPEQSFDPSGEPYLAKRVIACRHAITAQIGGLPEDRCIAHPTRFGV